MTLACLTATKPNVCSILREHGPEHALWSFDRKKIDEAKKSASSELKRENVTIITQDDEIYPVALFNLESPPVCLFLMGDPSSLLNVLKISVSMVGTRTATPQGMHIARSFARDISFAGIAVVSGLADGIDSASHEGVLDSDGVTIAVIGSGLGKLGRKKPLAERIFKKGAVISEFPFNFPAGRWTFSWRNRIIAGLSKGTLVVEAPKKSGALITAREAMMLGRDVMACPGLPGMASFAGCNQLIKDSAMLVDSPADVLDVLGVKSVTQEIELSDSELEILKVCENPVTLDEICEKLGKPPASILSVLTILDLRNIVKKLPGGIYMKSSLK